MNGSSISKATLGRLPKYLEYLKGLPEARLTISATVIANELSLGDVQVRKDLASVCGAGKPKIGYETDKGVIFMPRKNKKNKKYSEELKFQAIKSYLNFLVEVAGKRGENSCMYSNYAEN